MAACRGRTWHQRRTPDGTDISHELRVSSSKARGRRGISKQLEDRWLARKTGRRHGRRGGEARPCPMAILRNAKRTGPCLSDRSFRKQREALRQGSSSKCRRTSRASIERWPALGGRSARARQPLPSGGRSTGAHRSVKARARAKIDDRRRRARGARAARADEAMKSRSIGPQAAHES